MAENKKFLDSAGLSYLWGKIKDNFANQLKYENGELYLVDGLGERLESTIDSRKFGAIAVDTYAELIGYAKADYVGLTLYLRQAVTDGAVSDPKTYEAGAYVVTGDNGLLRLATSTATGDVNDALIALDGRISVLEGKLSGVDFATFATKSELGDLETTVSGKADTSALEEYVKKEEGKVLSSNDFTDDLKGKLEGINLDNYYLKTETYSKDEIDSAIEDVMTEAVKDSFLNDVDIDENDNLVFVWKMADGSTKTDSVNISKYIDTYTNGEGLSLSDKTFSVDFTKVAKAQDLTDLTTAFNDVKQTVDSIDLSKYVEKVDGKGLSTEDFTTEHKTKLEGIDLSAFYTKDDVYTKTEIDDMMPVALSTTEIDEAISKSNE